MNNSIRSNQVRFIDLLYLLIGSGFLALLSFLSSQYGTESRLLICFFFLVCRRRKGPGVIRLRSMTIRLFCQAAQRTCSIKRAECKDRCTVGLPRIIRAVIEKEERNRQFHAVCSFLKRRRRGRGPLFILWMGRPRARYWLRLCNVNTLEPRVCYTHTHTFRHRHACIHTHTDMAASTCRCSAFYQNRIGSLSP